MALSVVLGLLAGLTAPSTAAIHVDPMTHIRDDVSRIKVMMESVGGDLLLFFFGPFVVVVVMKVWQRDSVDGEA